MEDQLRKLLWDIKAVYDIAPGAAFEKVLISAEALFQENDLRTIVGEYERILEFMMESLEQERVDESSLTMANVIQALNI